MATHDPHQSGPAARGSSPRSVRIGDVLRTLLAIAAILPGLLGGLWSLVRTGDRRRAINRALSLWGSLGPRAAGIELRIEGAPRLDHRPAIFIINHQSGIDPILVCALLRRDFVGVAKSAIQKNPILGPAFRFVDTVFVARDGAADPADSLDPAAQACAQGLAIALAPEGTRDHGGSNLGRFRKGAFHLALTTRAPLIPIVILNSGLILPPQGWIMRAGTVDVRVLEPIDTRDWTKADLDGHVEKIEALYRAQLDDRRPAAPPPQL